MKSFLKCTSYQSLTFLLVKLIFVFCFAILQINAVAQNNYPITVNVQLAPPYPPYISDYQNKAILSFTNRGNIPLDVYIRGHIENDRGEYIQTKPNVFSNVPVHVPAMQTVVVQGNQLDENYLDLNNLQTNLDNTAYTNLFRLGLIPEGFYTFCIYAYTRDANGDYIPVSDPQSSSSCFSYNVGYNSPPIILSPMPDEQVFPTPGQNVNIIWTRPTGNIQNATLVYDLYLVKVLPNEDPQVSLTNAIEHGAGLFFQKSNLTATNFQFTNLTTFQLENGSEYALMVQAKDLTGKNAFENNGRSEISVFRYGFAGTIMSASGKLPIKKNASCSCVFNTASLDQTNNNASLKAGGNFSMASFTIQIGNIHPSGSAVSGEGTVLVNKVPIQINFKDVVVNKNGIAIAGLITGKQANGFDFLNNGGSPVLSTANYNTFMDQIKNYNINAIRNGIGLPLPFGLNSIAPNDMVNVGINSLTITPQQATYDAIAVVQLGDANSVLAMSANQVCFNNSSLMCGDAVFILDKDFNVPAINLKFKSYQSDDDPGTYVWMQKNEFKKFHIKAEYDFPNSLIKKVDGSDAIAILDADADKGWSDWTASVTMDPFKLSALDGVSFSLKTGMFYDHSTLRNPDGMPTTLGDPDLAEKDPVIKDPMWQGFFIPGVYVDLPSIVQDSRRPDQKLEIGATNLILDHDGLTGVVGAKNVLSIGDGSLGGWYCSLDKIAVKFLNSSYKTGGLFGKLILPFSDKDNVQSQIDYSCTLSPSKENGVLTYEFVAKQKNDIDFSAWWAHFNINNSSIKVINGNAGSSAVASADLSGALNLQGNVFGNKIDLKLIEVEHLVVQTQQPYVRVQNATIGLASPQHFIDGFPVNIKNVKPVLEGMHPGLQFDIAVRLSDIDNNLIPNATTTLAITAAIQNGRPIWKPSNFELQKVTLSGNLAGLVHIKEGSLEFFHDDPVFGDGIQGKLDASFAGLDAVEINTNVKFGNKSFNYWYFDASTTFPPIPVAPGISINGFGGGAFYNLKATANDNISAKDYFQNISKYQIGAYLPQSGSFGFKAKVGVCTNDGYIFTGWAEIGATFNTNGGFSLSSIDGSGSGELLRAVNGVIDDKQSPAKGAIDWHIGIADKVYDINGRVNIKEPPVGDALVEGNGFFDLMADIGNNDYYLKIGDPEKERASVSVAGPIKLDLNGYFMAGNHINASIPDPDPGIVDVSKLAGYKKLAYDPSGGGLVMGASLKLEKEFDYLVFYVKASAGIGFDVALNRYTQGCDNNGGLPGMNGWYALGQVYAGFKGEGGLYVDLFFFTGRVTAFQVNSSILLRGGLPNPYWFDGYAQFGYEALSGNVSGSVNFHFSIGDKCVPQKQIFTMPLVQELKPSDQTINVPLNAYPEVVFNYPAEKQFDLDITDDNGNEQVKSFRLKIENCTVTNVENNTLYANYFDAMSYPVFVDKDTHKDLMLGPDKALDPQTRYKLDITVKAQELSGTDWKDSYYNGAVVKESQSTVFKTGDCKLDDYISNPSSRVGAYPFPNQRYFLSGESKQGAIILDREYVCANGQQENYDLLVKFTALKNHAVIASYEKPVVLNGSKYLMFDIPTLPKECLIRVEVIKRKQLSPSDNYVLAKSNVPLITTTNRTLATTTAGLQLTNNQYQAISQSAMLQSPEYKQNVRFTSFNTNHALNLSTKTVDIVLYDYHFRTSRFSTLSEKINSMNYSATTGYSNLGSPTVSLQAMERFDTYDANGFVSNKYKGGSLVYFSLPLVTFKENSNYNSWLRNHALPCVYQSFFDAGIDLTQARIGSGISLQEIQHTGIACTDNGYCVPLRPIDIASYDGELTREEIAADELLSYYMKSLIKVVSVNAHATNFQNP